MEQSLCVYVYVCLCPRSLTLWFQCFVCHRFVWVPESRSQSGRHGSSCEGSRLYLLNDWLNGWLINCGDSKKGRNILEKEEGEDEVMNSTKKSLLVGQFTLLTMLPVSVDKVVISGDEEDQFRPKIQLYICWRFLSISSNLFISLANLVRKIRGALE